MNGNEKYFREKLEVGSTFLKASPKNIISLKYRETRNQYYYSELLDRLKSIKGLTVSDIGYKMNGHAWHLSYGKQNIILVEHETGLEILYIAGSVASIIGFVVQISSKILDHRRGHNRFPDNFEDVELRYFDKDDKFVEERKHNYLPYEVFLLQESNDSQVEELKKRVDKLEQKINILVKKRVKKKKLFRVKNIPSGEKQMPDRLCIMVIGNRNSGKSTTWKKLFG